MRSRFGSAGLTMTMSAPSSLSGADAEGAVEGGRLLRRINHDRRLAEAAVIQRVANGRHAPVHHVGRRDDIGARLRMGHGSPRQKREWGVVVDLRLRLPTLPLPH